MNLQAVHQHRAARAQRYAERHARQMPGLIARAERRQQRDKERRLLLRAIAELGGVYAVEAAILLGDESAKGVARARQRLNQLEARCVLTSRWVDDAFQSGMGRRHFRLAQGAGEGKTA